MRESNVSVVDRVVAININQTYRHGMNARDLYDCTRGIWRLSRTRAESAQYAFAIYQGVIKEVYTIDRWLPAGSTEYQGQKLDLPLAPRYKTRYEFTGKVAPDEVRDKYLGKTMPDPHTQNPIRYYNC